MASSRIQKEQGRVLHAPQRSHDTDASWKQPTQYHEDESNGIMQARATDGGKASSGSKHRTGRTGEA